MSGYEFSYLLNSVPESLAAGYLKESFRVELPAKGNFPVFLFVSYGNSNKYPSYQQAVSEFPEVCFFYLGTDRSCFVFCAEPKAFYRLLSWAEQHSCSKLADELNRKLQPQKATKFRIRDQTWDGSSPKIMAILNITPDSFFDGGKYYGLDDYEDVAARLIEEGASIIDIGGESTRPGSLPVTSDEEIERVLPAVKQIRNRFNIPISVDTVKAKVAKSVLAAGADMINDTSGLSENRELLDVIQEFNAGYCLMHIQGTPEKMQQNPEYSDVLADIYEFFLKKLMVCKNHGLADDKICIDPGIGFGKNLSHNLNLLRFLSVFKPLNKSILLGTSNKSFIGTTLNREPDQRLSGSLVTQVMGWLKGAEIFRVHDVEATRDALNMTMVYTDHVH